MTGFREVNKIDCVATNRRSRSQAFDQKMNIEDYILAGLLTLGLILVAGSKLVSFTDIFRNLRHGPDHDSMRSEIDKQRDILTLGCALVFVGIPAGVLIWVLYST